MPLILIDKNKSLAKKFPAIAAQWHPTKNGDLTPHKVSTRSNRKIWWICPNGIDHEYQAVIWTRTKIQTGCPICANKKVIPSNSLSTLMPDIAKEWHPTKNGCLTPLDVVPGCHKRVWWVCKKDKRHEWCATIKSRALAKTGCSICRGLRVIPSTSLVALFPDVALEWHPSKNGDLTPNDVGPGSNKKVWWKCPKGVDHEWKVSVFYRTKGNSKCPVCLNQKCVSSNSLATLYPGVSRNWDFEKNENLTPNEVVPGSAAKVWWKCNRNPAHSYQASISTQIKIGSDCVKCNEENNSLLSTHPELSKEWHPTKNAPLRPINVSRGSRKKIWWKCKNGHTWLATVKDRTCEKKKCRQCPKEHVIKENNLEKAYPELLKQWCFDRNVDISPKHVTHGCHKKVWWHCDEGHFWQAVISSRTKQKTGCPYCSGLRATKLNNLTVTHPELLREWHPTKNKGMSPHEITSGSDKRINWICKNGHEWLTSVYERAKGKTGCAKCPKILKVSKNNLAETHPHLLQEWCFERNSSITPLNVIAGSKKKIWWRCHKGHEWDTSIYHRTIKKTGCPYCCGKKVTPDNNLLVTHPELEKEWHYEKNGNVKPENVTFGVGKKYWWKCINGHEWQASPNNRAGKGSGCRLCSSQSSTEEIRIFCELKSIFEDVRWREKVDGVELDIYIPHLKIGVEIDGSYWHKSKIQKDLDKNERFNEKGIKVLRLKDDQFPYDFPGSHTYKVSNLGVDDIKALLGLMFNERETSLSEKEKSAINDYYKLNQFVNNIEFESKLHYFPGPMPQHSLKHLHPSLCEEWDYEANAPLIPENFKAGSDKKIWWECTKKHRWQSSIYERAKRKSGCPYCKGKRASSENNLRITHPFIADEWHPEKNGDLKPEDIMRGSNKKIWWLCKNQHEWLEMPNNRTNRKHGCPHCYAKRI